MNTIPPINRPISPRPAMRRDTEPQSVESHSDERQQKQYHYVKTSGYIGIERRRNKDRRRRDRASHRSARYDLRSGHGRRKTDQKFRRVRVDV